MVALTKEEVRALGHAMGLEIHDPELTEVTYSLNALLEDLDEVNPQGLDNVEPIAHYPAPEVSRLGNGILHTRPLVDRFLKLRLSPV
jgi:Asp-tRNA(Asn)/Glu-tRNA(Gln) amidotransferase C subunit